MPEVFGVRVPPPSDTLTAVNFDLVPNKPPPDAKLYDEEVEDIEEEEEELPDGLDEDEDADMEPATIPYTSAAPVTPTDIDMSAGTPAPVVAAEAEGSDEEADGLFGAEGDDDDDISGDDAMEEVQTAEDTQANGLKRKLVEEDDYD